MVFSEADAQFMAIGQNAVGVIADDAYFHTDASRTALMQTLKTALANSVMARFW